MKISSLLTELPTSGFRIERGGENECTTTRNYEQLTGLLLLLVPLLVMHCIWFARATVSKHCLLLFSIKLCANLIKMQDAAKSNTHTYLSIHLHGVISIRPREFFVYKNVGPHFNSHLNKARLYLNFVFCIPQC